jgi:hypothetical protein
MPPKYRLVVRFFDDCGAGDFRASPFRASPGISWRDSEKEKCKKLLAGGGAGL